MSPARWQRWLVVAAARRAPWGHPVPCHQHPGDTASAPAPLLSGTSPGTKSAARSFAMTAVCWRRELIFNSILITPNNNPFTAPGGAGIAGIPPWCSGGGTHSRPAAQQGGTRCSAPCGGRMGIARRTRHSLDVPTGMGQAGPAPAAAEQDPAHPPPWLLPQQEGERAELKVISPICIN